MIKNFKFSILESTKIKKKLLNKKFVLIIEKIIKEIYLSLKIGNKIYICGNGGSAADAQHLSAEFLVRLNPKNNRKAYPLISLTENTTFLTACGNDFGFTNIFKRNLEAVGKKNDILIALSTSGNSQNIIKVIKQAKKMDIKTISFLGKKGGRCLGLSNIELIVPSNNVARIQECHMFLGHFILNEVEKKLMKLK